MFTLAVVCKSAMTTYWILPNVQLYMVIKLSYSQTQNSLIKIIRLIKLLIFTGRTKPAKPQLFIIQLPCSRLQILSQTTLKIYGQRIERLNKR